MFNRFFEKKKFENIITHTYLYLNLLLPKLNYPPFITAQKKTESVRTSLYACIEPSIFHVADLENFKGT